MTRLCCILLSIYLALTLNAQENGLQFKGQISGYGHYNPSNNATLWFGSRYLPQLNCAINVRGERKIDFELSANIYGNAAVEPFSHADTDGDVKPYRAWVRYSSSQLEIRAGLQKINFGSATMLRPLMWFDQIDPRDPLKLTDGVWGILGRYYFLNNANVWLWGLYGNPNPKGWEQLPTNNALPEFGGRIQLPIPFGETGLSFHHRIADSRNTALPIPSFDKIEENRLGLDVRLDWIIGTWFEASWVAQNEALGIFKNQEVFNLGCDYTFGIGNGLNLVFEQLLVAYDANAFALNDPVSFSMLALSYPLGLFDNINAIAYYDWSNKNAYNFINYQKQFGNLSLFLMAYWNPDNYAIPTQSGTNLFGGKGAQLMLVWNH